MLENIDFRYFNKYLELCRYWQTTPPAMPSNTLFEVHHIIMRSWIDKPDSGWNKVLTISLREKESLSKAGFIVVEWSSIGHRANVVRLKALNGA